MLALPDAVQAPTAAPTAYKALSRAEARALSRCAPLSRRADPVAPAVTSGQWLVTAEPDQVGFARRQVAAFAALAGMPDDDAMAELQLAVSEALTNAVMHAYRDREPAGTVLVQALAEADELTIRVRDYGMGIAPRSDAPGLGIGLTIMARLAKVSSVRRCEGGGTEISMSFALHRVAAGTRAAAALAAAPRS